MQEIIAFANTNTRYVYYDGIASLPDVVNGRKVVFITDNHVHHLHRSFFQGKDCIVIPQGEASKSLTTVEDIIKQLMTFEANRKSVIIGVGGGMITDITGFVAAVYMRGIAFGFIPTTLLAMVDAAIGGKNGVNTGLYKNMIGTIRQPEFILYQQDFLASLPQQEWSNGFAEVIKYACLFDKLLFEELEANNLFFYQNNQQALNTLIQKCARWKNKTVVDDEQERDIRKLLNFGHTAGHALENKYQLSHGSAVAIGMLIACRISISITELDITVKERLEQLLIKYELPVHIDYNTHEVMQILKMDKKSHADTIDYILLKDIGTAIIRKVDFNIIAQHLAHKY